MASVKCMGAEHVTTLEKFRVRPGYKSRELLVEFCGDHRSSSYPNIANLLQDALNAKLKKHPVYDTVRIGLATDEFITLCVGAHSNLTSLAH